MMKLNLLLFFVLTVSLEAAPPSLPKRGPSIVSDQVGKAVLDFKLRNVNGIDLSLSNFSEAKGFIIVFTCNHCPFARLYSGRLNELSRRYQPLGVPLIAVNPMDSMIYSDETFPAMQDHAVSEGFIFPYLQDARQDVARQFNAEHTPQAFVIWKEGTQWIIRYSGAVDDNGTHSEKATPFLADAVDRLLAGRLPENPETDSFGCRIFYRDR